MAQFIDLSHTIPANMQYASYSKARRSQVVPWHNILETTIQESKLLMFSDHVATHVEAPSHFNPDGKTIDQMPVDLVFERPAVWVDLSHTRQRDSITPARPGGEAPRHGLAAGRHRHPLHRRLAALGEPEALLALPRATHAGGRALAARPRHHGHRRR